MNNYFEPDPVGAIICIGVVFALVIGFFFLYLPWRDKQHHKHLEWLHALRVSYRQSFVSPQYDYASSLEQAEQLMELNTRLASVVQTTTQLLQQSSPPVPVVQPPSSVLPVPTPQARPAPVATSTVTYTARVPALDLTKLQATAPTISKPAVPDPTGPPTFEKGEPEHLGEFESQQAIVSYLQAMIQALDGSQTAVSPIVFTGAAGTGKTALMKAFANSLRLRNLKAGLGETDYLELFPADIANRDDLERVLRRASVRPSVLRVDELHTIDREHAVLLYEVLATGTYRFAGDTQMTPMHNVTVIAATTDFSMLHEALRRRFEHMVFEPLTPEEIAAAVRRRPFPITDDALEELVNRTSFSGVLWEALRYFKQGETFARAAGCTVVDAGHMQQVYTLNALDNYGLTALDRRVIEVMLRMPRTRTARGGVQDIVAYGGAELQIAQVSKVDLGTYRQIIKPKLLARELITTRPPYGQVLTERAVTLYQGT